ncbi:MAG: hypothetical protein WBM13_02515 [Bacteroidia bacterium]
MKKIKWDKLKKIDTIILSILLCFIVALYILQFNKVANKNGIFGPDEFFYYLEAKAISAHNIYQTPLTLDGNTSIIGDFGSHGICYALKDGWLAKLFFQADDPPGIFINLLTFIITLLLILLFKPFEFNTRVKIALIVCTYHILYYYTLSYMQETIQFLFAVLALRTLYMLYNSAQPQKSKYLYYYLAIILIAIAFRYGWFIWSLGLLPMAINIKDFFKWIGVVLGVMLFALFIAKYIYAPYPYEEIVAYKIIGDENFSIINSLIIVFKKFFNNLNLFITPDKSIVTTAMRYLLLVLLLLSTWFSIEKRSKFTIACTIISWGYLLACLALYFLDQKADERVLAVLNPVLAFCLVGNGEKYIFYPIIIVQLLVFPTVFKERNANLDYALRAINTPEAKISRVESYTKIRNLVDQDKPVIINVTIDFSMNAQNFFIDFPLTTDTGYPILYYLYINGANKRGKYKPQYNIAVTPIFNPNEELIYSDRWIYFYKIK